MRYLGTIAKALAAGGGAAFVIYQRAKGIATPGGEAVTLDEWVDAAVTFLGVGFGVWLIPNTPTTSSQPAADQ